MSSEPILATITVALSQIFEAAARQAIPGALAQPARPREEPFSRSHPVIHLYLHQVTPNPAYRNVVRPPSGPGGESIKQAFDVHYLLAFYGDEADLAPQRMLNSALRALIDHPILTPKELNDAAHQAARDVANYRFLSGVNLDETCEPVRLALETVSLNELTALWSRFLNSPYTLSQLIVASPVMI